MRYTKKISMFPVGLVTSFGVSSPVVRNGFIDGFYDGWVGGRKFPVDMAGFAVSVKFILSRPKARMPFSPGYEEDGFLKSLLPFDLKEIELLASNCSEVSGRVLHCLLWILIITISLSLTDSRVAHADKEESCGSQGERYKVRRHKHYDSAGDSGVNLWDRDLDLSRRQDCVILLPTKQEG